MLWWFSEASVRFPAETCEVLHVLREGLRQDLDRDVASEDGVGGPIDFAHAARPDSSGDFVRADPSADEHWRGILRDWTVSGGASVDRCMTPLIIANNRDRQPARSAEVRRCHER